MEWLKKFANSLNFMPESKQKPAPQEPTETEFNPQEENLVAASVNGESIYIAQSLMDQLEKPSLLRRAKKWLSGKSEQPATNDATSYDDSSFNEAPHEAAPNSPQFDGGADLNLEQKPRLVNRIIEGLPGFLGGAGAVMAAKMATGAVMASVSAPALATVAAAAGVGAFVNQSVIYARARHAHLKDQAALAALSPDVSADSLSVADKIARELKAYGSELKSKAFWKGAATKGLIAGSLGATFAFAASNDAVHDALLAAKDKLAAVVKPFNPFANFFSPPAPVRIETGVGKVAKHILPAAPAPEPTPAPVDIPQAAAAITPPTLLEELKYLLDSHGITDPKITQLLERAEAGDAQSVKDLAMGLNNEKLGLPLDRALARDLYEMAAANGNAQAIRDLAVLDGTAPAAAPAIPDVPAPAADLASEGTFETPVSEPAPTVDPGNHTDLGTDNEADVRVLPISMDGTSQADTLTDRFNRDFDQDVRPAQLGNEAARCVLGLAPAGGEHAVNTMCSIFKESMTANDHVVVQSADMSLEEKYAPTEAGEQSTQEFATNARRDFRDNFFMRAFGVQPL